MWQVIEPSVYHKPFSHRDSTLLLQRRLKAALECHVIQHQNQTKTKPNQRRCDGAHNITSVCFFLRVSQVSTNLNMYLQTIYNHMDAVTMRCD